MEIACNDTYKAISDLSNGIYKEKGSKFIAQAMPVQSVKDINKKLEITKKKYNAARHHCYAYQLGVEKHIFRFNDDGEPSGTAGKPIYNQILSYDLTNILIVVTRYFGGIKLGTSVLANAYKTAARYALENAIIQSKTINDIYEIEFEYEDTNDVMKIINKEKLQQIDKVFDIKCKLKIEVRKNDAEKVYNLFKKNKKLKINYLRTE